MGTLVLNFIFGLLKTELVKTAIGIGVNKLLEAKGDGITKDIAEVMIDGIAKSKQNPTTEDMFLAAKSTLTKGE